MKKYVVIAFFPLFLIFFILIMLVSSSDDEKKEKHSDDYANSGLSVEVLAYKSLVEKYCKQEGIPDKVSIILGIMMQESGGRVQDVMQSSESLGLPVNSLAPEESIAQGVKYFAGLLKQTNDEDTAIQSYNFGGGFISWLQDKGGKYSLKLAEQFSDQMASQMGWSNYGDKEYVPHVRRYISGGNDQIVGSDFAKKVMNEALKYQGYPYVFGGVAPTAFDCSSLTQWCYQSAGVTIPRTAQDQYDSMKHVDLKNAKIGDLVFFHSTYNAGEYVTHVGIYVGNNRMYHAGDPLGYADLTTAYWQQHLIGAGTVQ